MKKSILFFMIVLFILPLMIGCGCTEVTETETKTIVDPNVKGHNSSNHNPTVLPPVHERTEKEL
jgi:hypothetical protein